MNTTTDTPNKVTIIDVAQKAGVSIKTVSRVANNYPHVSDRTREKVQRAIDVLGYSADPYARYLGSLRSAAIADKKGKRGSVAAKLADTDKLIAPANLAATVNASAPSKDRDIDWW